ncbi:MAG: response regulator [Eubacteriales bacterium]|nr:response regulator [Eubacteriales bacterium]
MIKLLIVEDEVGIRESLIQAYSWTELGCELIGSASSGIEALEICLRTQPDIIISDIVLPGIDGLTFLKYMKEKAPSTCFIILTGHRNFDYAKDALNLGAAFFMLKPINYTELKEAILKSVDQIISTSEQKENENKQEQVLRNLLNGRIFSKTHLTPHVRRLLDSLNIYRIIILKFDDTADDTFRTQNLVSYCQELLKNTPVILVRTDDSHVAVLYLLNSEKENLQDFREFLSQLQERIYSFFHQSLSLGISSRQYGQENLRAAYIEALRSLGKRFFTGEASINFFSPEDDIKKSAADYRLLSEESNKVFELIQQGNPENMAQNCSSVFQELITPLGDNTDIIKSTVLILTIITAKKIFGNDIRQLNLFFKKYENFSGFIRTESLQRLEDLFLNIILDLSDYYSVKNNPRQVLIQTILHFIEQNFQNNISLNDISQKVYLSPSYLSSLIASETGKNFVDILNEIRIQKAIEYLKEPQKKISEIAHAVGFREAQYFTMTFKKYMDITPRDYRELFLKQ